MNTPDTGTSGNAFGTLVLNESRLAWRTPVGLGSGLGLPLTMLIVFGSIPALSRPNPVLGGVSYFVLSFPILLVMTVVVLSVAVMPRTLINYRERGILRRLSVTPVPPAWLLGAQVVINLAIVILGLIILMVSGVAAFGLTLPRNLPAFLLAVILTITSFFALGLFIAAVVRIEAAAQAVSGFVFFALMFFGGIWLPRPIMPPLLLEIGDWTPLGASVGTIQSAMQGTAISLQSLMVLVLYTVILGYLAVRSFRWE